MSTSTINMSQVFYSGKSAMLLEITRNGIFLVIAPAKGKNENNNMTFNWQNAKTSKMSISELTWIKKGLEVFFKDGEAEYKKEGIKLSKNEKYANIQFVHVTPKSEKRVGLEAYNNSLSFVIVDKTGTQKYYIQSIDIYRLIEFLSKLIDTAFMYESLLLDEARREASKLSSIPPAPEAPIQKINMDLFEKAIKALSTEDLIKQESERALFDFDCTEDEINQINSLVDKALVALDKKITFKDINTEKVITLGKLKENVKTSFNSLIKDMTRSADIRLTELDEKLIKYMSTYEIPKSSSWLVSIYEDAKNKISSF